jgi:hypothetical protein
MARMLAVWMIQRTLYTLCDCPVLACKRYRIWGSMFLQPEDVETVRVSSLLSQVANTGLGSLSLLTGEEIQ